MHGVRILVASLVFAFVSMPGRASAEFKVGVVDLQRAILATEDGMRAAKSLNDYTKRKQAELRRVEKKLQREQKEIQRQGRFLSRAAFARRYEHWQRRVVDVQTKTVEFNRLLQRKQQQLLGPISQKLVKVVNRVARKGQFAVVVDRAVAPYARTDLDLTERVVRLYNSGAGASAGTEDKSDAAGGDSMPPLPKLP